MHQVHFQHVYINWQRTPFLLGLNNAQNKNWYYPTFIKNMRWFLTNVYLLGYLRQTKQYPSHLLSVKEG